MNNIIKRKWNQNSMVIIEDLQGMAFQAESGGHTFQISGIDGEGNTVALSGTPAGVMLRADGQDVTLTCSVSGGVVSATLPANAYSVPGRFGLTIFLTSDGQKTAIYAAVGTVGKTSSGTVAPPAGSDVVTLVNQINTAIAAIPANYNACFAPAYSTSGLYSVGQYVTYNGNLYRCNTAITTAETWTAAHWTQTNLGADVYDLKSALLQNNAMYGMPKMIFGNATVASDGTITYYTTGRYYGAITPPNVYAYFLKGTTLFLTDYSETRFGVSRVDLSTGKSPDGSGWVESGAYTVENEGYYLVNIQDKNLTAKSEVEYFTRFLIVSNDMRVNALEGDVKEIQEEIGKNYVPELVLGNVSVNSSGVATYQSRSYGAITPQGQYAFFTKGTVISLSSYQLTEQVAVKFFVNYKKPDETNFPWGSGWTTSGSYEIPKTGNYIINIQSSPTTNQDSASVFSDLLVVSAKPLSERVDILEEKVAEKEDGFYSFRGIKANRIINNYFPQGACCVGDDVLFFSASNDTHTNHAKVGIYNISDLTEKIGEFEHNTGHAGSADYANDTDTLLIANSADIAVENPFVYLIGGYAAKLAERTDIEYNASDVSRIDFSDVLENGLLACFGETGDFVYVISGDNSYDDNPTKTICKVQIGYGTNNMVSLFPSDSIGTYSYIDDNSPNGTAKVIGKWEVDFYGELQGLKYVNGKLIVTMDTRYIGNIKTPFIIVIEVDNNKARLIDTLWIPVISKDGSRPANEAEDIVFVNGKGYVTANQHIYEFDESGL